MNDTERVAKHIIADISYALDRLVCSCGVVMRAAAKFADWTAHRRENGLSAKSIDGHDLRGKSPRGKAFTIRRPPTPSPEHVCGKVTRNRYAEWPCAVIVPAGATGHFGQHLGTDALAAQQLRRERARG